MADLQAILQDPITGVVAVSLVAIVLWLVFAPQYTPQKPPKKLNLAEEDERIAQWSPKPMVPASFNPAIHTIPEPVVIKSSTGPVIVSEDDKEYLNFASNNYLGLASLPELKELAQDAIREYGVGSCGPRGFYGTVDLHLQLEHTFSKFMGAPDTILYSDGMACLSSVIPAFAKAGDHIIVDEAAHCGIAQGIKLSRSKITRFEHNNLTSLEERLKQNDEAMSPLDKTKHRRFIVVEGICQKTGNICQLDKVVALAKKYKFRIILDDSCAIGVLGKTGRGSLEHFNLKLTEDVEIVCATLDTSLSSVGGLCIGSNIVVSHQRLAGSGYCFSAASPPYTAKVATHAIGLVDNNPELIAQLQIKTAYNYNTFLNMLGSNATTDRLYDVLGNPMSPIVVLRPSITAHHKWSPALAQMDHKAAAKNTALYLQLKLVAQILRDEHQIVCSLQHRAPQEDPYPFGLKFSVTVLHSDEDIAYAVKTIDQVTRQVLSQQ